MSWHNEFHAASRTSAKQEVTRLQTLNPMHFPPVAASMVVAAIDALPDVADAIVYVKTNGHIDSFNGNVEVVARLIKVV